LIAIYTHQFLQSPPTVLPWTRHCSTLAHPLACRDTGIFAIYDFSMISLVSYLSSCLFCPPTWAARVYFITIVCAKCGAKGTNTGCTIPLIDFTQFISHDTIPSVSIQPYSVLLRYLSIRPRRTLGRHVNVNRRARGAKSVQVIEYTEVDIVCITHRCN
jgi:hypothetical protein